MQKTIRSGGEKFRVVLIFLYLFLIGTGLVSCVHSDRKNETSSDSPKNNLKYARHFDMLLKEDYTKLTIIDPWQKSTGLRLDYYLVKEGKRIPEGVDSMNVIKVPVRRIVLMSTTYIPMITALGESNSVIAVSGTSLVCDREIKERINRRLIYETGYEEYLNKELIISLSPDLIVAYGIGSATAGNMRKLQEAGIRILFNAEYLEEDPLGRAEWIKVFGALFCRKAAADSIFSLVEKRYNTLKSWLSEKIKTRPKVMLGLPWKDAWYVSPGNSYISRLIEDAGGEYIWKNIIADHAIPFGIENVLVSAADASFWLNTGNATDLKSVLIVDQRLSYLPVFKKGNLYNNNKRISDGGGNDYWESGTLNPDIILNDISSILHPEYFPDYIPYYYRKLE